MAGHTRVNTPLAMPASPSSKSNTYRCRTGDPLLPLLWPLLPCLDGYLLWLCLATCCEADSPRATRFIYRKQNREDPILEFGLNIVDIDRPGEGDRPFKRARGNFLDEPVVPLSMAVRLTLHPALLLLAWLLRRRTLHLTCLPLLLPLHLTRLPLLLALLLGTHGRLLMLVLIAVATSNRQGVLINRDFDIFRAHPRQRNVHLVAIRRLTDVHWCYQRCARHQTGIHNALVK